MKKTLFSILFSTFITIFTNQSIAQSDANLTGLFRLNASGYSVVPDHHLPDTLSFLVIVTNDSASTLTNVQMKYSMLKDGVIVQEDSTSIDSISGESSSIFGIGSGYIITEKGNYNVRYEITHDSAEATPLNNVAFPDSLVVGDSILSRYIGDVIATGVGFPNGSKGELGSTFFIPNPDTLTSVRLGIENRNGQMTNQDISVNIRSYNNGRPGAIIASSDTITYTAAGAAFVDFYFRNKGNFVELPADSFVVTAVQFDRDISLGTTTSVFFGGVNWGFNNGIWRSIDNQFRVAFMMELNFGIPNVIPVGLNENSSIISNLSIYPNPSNGVFTVSAINENSNNQINVQVLDMQGKLLKESTLTGSKFLQESFNLEGYEKGIYLIKLNQREKIITERIVIR